MGINTTDYEFPEGWGLFTAEQKHTWFVRERVFRQACQQDTSFGNRYQAVQEEKARLDTDRFKPDEDLK